MERRVRLRGGLERTASSVIVGDDGAVVVEFYDFSSDAENMFGNDVALLVTVDAADKGAMLERLAGGTGREGGGDELLLRLAEERFGDYFEVVRWLDENDVPYRKSFDPRA